MQYSCCRIDGQRGYKIDTDGYRYSRYLQGMPFVNESLGIAVMRLMVGDNGSNINVGS